MNKKAEFSSRIVALICVLSSTHLVTSPPSPCGCRARRSKPHRSQRGGEALWRNEADHSRGRMLPAGRVEEQDAGCEVAPGQQRVVAARQYPNGRGLPGIASTTAAP